MPAFKGKVGVVQRVLPHYRAPFFNTLGLFCVDGLSIFAGKPQRDEMIRSVETLEHAHLLYGKNYHFLRGSFYVCIQSGLIQWLTEWDPDVLIIEANPRYLRSPAAIRWMHQKERPVIGWGLGAPTPDKGSLLASFRQRRRKSLIRQFDTLITYSQIGAAEYATLGFPEDRIFVAHNAVKPPPSHPVPKRPLPTADQPARVIYVGRLQERKQIDNLLQACALLPMALQPELVIIGDGPARKRWEMMAKVIYPSAVFTGVLYGEALEEQFLKADLLVLPGTGGLAIQEAMSYGLPIIAAEADGTQADLVRADNGWLVPPNDTDALKSAIEAALVDIPALRLKGAKSYQIVAEEINLDRMVDVFIKALTRSMS